MHYPNSRPDIFQKKSKNLIKSHCIPIIVVYSPMQVKEAAMRAAKNTGEGGVPTQHLVDDDARKR